MKINGIEVEGTPEEIALILKTMTSVSETLLPDNVTTPLSNDNLVIISDPPLNLLEEVLTSNPVLDEYLQHLYRYKPNRYSQNARAPYVVKILADAMGQYFTIKQLMKMANANQSTVSSGIRRAAAGGCVIEVASKNKILTRTTKVRMTKLGTPQEADKIRLSLSTKPDVKPTPSRVRPQTVSSSPQREEIVRLLQAKNNHD